MIYTNRILISALLFIAVTLIGACGGSNSSTIADVVEQVAQGGSAERGEQRDRRQHRRGSRHRLCQGHRQRPLAARARRARPRF